MGLFDKKYCDICGDKIGLLGNRKLEDGNCCKNCAKKLSPWFGERRHSTVGEIKAQLAYREENQTKAAQFQITQELGKDWRVLFDDTHSWFTLTRARNLAEENPDILDYSQLTGSRLDVEETRRELKRQDKDGKQVSYNPPRYEYSYNFDLTVTVNSPYFDEMKFRVNPRPVTLESEAPRGFSIARAIDPTYNIEYRRYKQQADEICEAIEKARSKSHTAPAAPAAQSEQPTQPQTAPVSGPWTCPACGGSNTGKFCEYCGTPRP